MLYSYSFDQDSLPMHSDLRKGDSAGRTEVGYLGSKYLRPLQDTAIVEQMVTGRKLASAGDSLEANP
jgi:hypothetical protein